MASPSFGGAARIAVESRLRRDLEKARIEWQAHINRWKALTLDLPPGVVQSAGRGEEARLQMLAARQRYEVALHKFEAVVLHGIVPGDLTL
jgi:hypothetical protein